MGKKTGRARGRPSRIPDEQTKFLSGFWSSWDDARAENDRTIVSSFYNDVATQFLQKFGPPVPKSAEEASSGIVPSTSSAVEQGAADADTNATFNINALDPTLRNIGPNNTTVPHAQVTFPLQPSPPNAQDHPTLSTSAGSSALPSQSPKNDWSRTRSVSLHLDNLALFIFV